MLVVTLNLTMFEKWSKHSPLLSSPWPVTNALLNIMLHGNMSPRAEISGPHDDNGVYGFLLECFTLQSGRPTFSASIIRVTLYPDYIGSKLHRNVG